MAEKYASSKKIGKITLDMSAYSGTDEYSDGDVENDILAYCKKGCINEALLNDTRWPVFYHLSPIRENLLNWFPFKNNASALEIGMGCGAVTGVLCRSVATVEGVEISARRAEIAAWRHKDCANLTIHVGNLNDMKINKKFDYVTLIGVLEYAGSFTHTDSPYQNFLQACRKYLKPDGKLLIAIENKFGLKYWSGAREDHTGKLFDGITGYQGNKKVKTFSKPELTKLLHNSGYDNLEWYYPFPDYKLPNKIYSDDHLPKAGEFKDNHFVYYDMDRYALFNEAHAMNEIATSELFDIFSNSFLVCCSNGEKQ